MKRSVLAVAVVALLAMFAVTAFALPPKTVGTQVSLNFDPGPPDTTPPYNQYGEGAVMSGRVKGKNGPRALRRKCQRGRIVRIKRANNGDPVLVGEDITARNGTYSVPVPNIQAGAHFAKAKKKTVRFQGARIWCGGARSVPVTVPVP